MRLKPDLSSFFMQMPLVGVWIKSDYERAKTLEDLTNLFHKWLSEAENTTNEVRKQCYTASATYLYNFLTYKSYQSTNFKEA